MSDNNHWMPLYVGDYLADTMHLSGPEHGAYLLLLMHSWRAGALPDDDRKLAAIARTDPKAWRLMRDTILEFFTATDVGFVQGRLERIRDEQAAKVEQRRAAGKASAEARKAQREGNERSTTVEIPLAPRTREPEPEPDIPSEATPLRGAASPSRRGSRLPADVLPDWLPADAWADWRSHRRKGWTPNVATLCIRNLGKLRDEGHDPRAVIEQSIANGWTGLFPIKAQGGFRQASPTEGRRAASMRLFREGYAGSGFDLDITPDGVTL